MAVRITRVPPKLITSETNNHHKIVGLALHKEFNREFTIDFKTANDIQHYLKTVAERSGKPTSITLASLSPLDTSILPTASPALYPAS